LEELLRVERVVKRFGGITALDGVTLSIMRGELMAIIGPNGSGKTTLFNVINGVLKPDSGRIVFEGIDVTDLPPYKRVVMGIARTFQIPKPWPSLTVRENVAIGALFGSMQGRIGAREALELADEVLEIVGLSGKAEVEAGKLTVPEKKVLELARAIAMRPKLLMLDEVVAGMSPKDADRIVDVVKRIRDEYNIAVVSLVEHVMRVVTRFAERVVVMNQGRVIKEGPPGEVLRDPLVQRIYLGGAL